MTRSGTRPNPDGRLVSATGLAKAGAFEQAILQLKELLEDDPRHEIALGMLAAIYAQIGMHDRAIECYREVLGINPRNALARFQLGLAQLLAKAPEAALETWRPLLEEEGDFMAHFHSALALIQLERREEARPLLERAKQRMPASHPLYPEAERLLGE